jgi:hypothetical protein
MAELYTSLSAQTWLEWVVLMNGEVKRDDFPAIMLTDQRVRLLEAPADIEKCEGIPNIGALKAAACKACTGDVLVEVDHDDLLTPGILAAVSAAFDENPDVVLVYSNCAEFHEADGSPHDYGERGGWRYRDFQLNGRLYREIVAPPPTAYHCSLILYAPNHVRAFRRSAYEAAGGHNPGMRVLDDQDLIARMFLRGPFLHLDRCGYLYRIHGKNAWLRFNGEIQAHMRRVQHLYLDQMIQVEATRAGWQMLDLGGSHNCPPGYTCVDRRPPRSDTPYIIADLNGRYPFESGEVGVIRAADFLEHVADKMHSLHEIHRVLRPGGHLISLTPSTSGPNGEAGRGADQDPTHVSRWNSNSFWYVTRRQFAQYIDNTTVKFAPVWVEDLWPSEECQRNFIPYVRANLMALKDHGPRPFGSWEI